MKYYFLFALVLTAAFSGQAFAQDSVQGTNSANADAGSQSGASAGAQLVQNSYQGGHLRETIDAQSSIGVGAYGSFSQNNCVNAEAGALTTKIFGISITHGKPDIHCYHGVTSDQYGKESQLAFAHGKAAEAEDLRAMGVWSTCTSDDENIQMCLDMGKIRKVGEKHYVPVSVTVGVAEVIPSRPAGWTGIAGAPAVSQVSAAPVQPTVQSGQWTQAHWATGH